MDKDLSVTDVARLGRPSENAGDLVHEGVGHNYLDLDLGKKIHGVLATTVELRVALLPTEAADFGDRHADDADAGKGLFDGVQLEVLDESFDLVHKASRGALDCTCRAGRRYSTR